MKGLRQEYRDNLCAGGSKGPRRKGSHLNFKHPPFCVPKEHSYRTTKSFMQSQGGEEAHQRELRGPGLK